MGTFDTVFKSANEQFTPKLASNSLESMADEVEIGKLRSKMRDDNISIDGLMYECGTLGLISRTAALRDIKGVPYDTPRIVPDAITRIENMEALSHPIVIKPVFKKKYVQKDFKNDDTDYFVYTVPYIPGMDQKPTNDDIKRTIQVLKATNKAHHLWDKDLGNFVFIEGLDKKPLSYPSSDDVPDDFKGKPIAFVRDLNAVPQNVDEERSLARLKKWMTANIGMEYDDLLSAPQSCVDACKQQDALVLELAGKLNEAGIQPNVELPHVPKPEVPESWAGRTNGKGLPIIPPAMSRF